MDYDYYKQSQDVMSNEIEKLLDLYSEHSDILVSNKFKKKELVNNLKSVFDYTNDKKSINEKMSLAKKLLNDTNFVDIADVPMILIKKSIEIVIDYVLEHNNLV
jgi:hypothetical protein